VSKADGPRIGIDLGGTKIEAVLMDPAGEILRRERVPTPRHDYGKTIEAIHDLVEQLERDLGPPATVGIGTPGAISPATGLVKNANSVWLNGKPLLHDLQRELNREVRMANDADCFALSEAIDGAGRDAEIVFGVILGTGVGGGIVHGRRLLSGPNAIAGEWGHNGLPWPRDEERPGPDCYCGLTGCIETFLSGPGLERDYAAAVGATMSTVEIVAAAEDGDALADAALQRYEQRLARALSAVINVVDPHLIVLGGGLSQVLRLYENVPALWEPFVFSDRVDTRLAPPVHGDSGGVRGAAWLW
jgi:fructokinase